MSLPVTDNADRDPFACAPLDAAVFVAALAISTQYMMALASLAQQSMWGAVSPTLFWAGLFGAPLAAMAPAWLIGRFIPVNPLWGAIGLATPPTIWAVGLLAEPLALLLVGGAAAGCIALTILPARHGRRRRVRSILRKGRCIGCGYDLSGLGGGVCPECGRQG